MKIHEILPADTNAEPIKIEFSDVDKYLENLEKRMAEYRDKIMERVREGKPMPKPYFRTRRKDFTKVYECDEYKCDAHPRGCFFCKHSTDVFYDYARMERLVEFARESADKLEACGVPFDDEPKVVDADFEETDDVLQKPLKECYAEGELCVRAFNVLKAAGAQTFGDVVALRKADVLCIHTCGKKTIEDIENLLHSYGYDWAVD